MDGHVDIVAAGHSGEFIEAGDLALGRVEVFAGGVGFLSVVIFLPDERTGRGIDLENGRMDFGSDGDFLGIFYLVGTGGGGGNIEFSALIQGEGGDSDALQSPGDLAVLRVEGDQVALIEEIEFGTVLEAGVFVGEALDKTRR